MFILMTIWSHPRKRLPGRRARGGQTIVFLLMALTILIFALLWNIDLHRLVAGKSHAQNAGDAAALAAARWQGESLNLVGELNLMHALALSANDGAAAGAITSFFRAVLNPGDEVICPSPYFVEYASYCGHFGGVLKPVPSKQPSFDLDLDAIAAAVTDKTRAILFNSPNNPTCCIYSEATVDGLAALVAEKNKGRERPIFILSDEPYRFLAYDGAVVPPVLCRSPFAVVLGSFSKSLSMAGERVGYLAINPAMPDADKFMAAVTITTRTLGFVNAPIIGQRLANAVIDSGVDLEIYARRRRMMMEVLDNAGLSYAVPRGAFYIFPAVPGGDDIDFVGHLLTENILAVPGSGFGCKGFMRLSFSVENDVIVRSADAFKRAVASYKGVQA